MFNALQAEKIKFQLKYLGQLIDHKETLEEKKDTEGLTLTEQEELAEDNEALKVQHASEGGAIWGVIGGIGLATVTGLTGLFTLSALAAVGGFSGLQVARENALNAMVKQSGLKPQKNALQDICLEHNVLKQGINGMTIHFSFMSADLKESKCGAMAPFYYEYKQPLRDFKSVLYI